MDNTEKLSSVAIDSTFAFLDGVHGVQTQAIELGNAWLKALAGSQKIGWDLSKTMFQQSVEVQSLWRTYATQSVKDLNGHLSTGAVKPEKSASTK